MAFVAALSVINEGIPEANKILEYYSDLLNTKDKSQKTIIRSDFLEQSIKNYFNRRGEVFRTGTGPESDLISTQASVNFNIDIKAKEALDTGSGIKVGGGAVQIGYIISQIETIRQANILMDGDSTKIREVKRSDKERYKLWLQARKEKGFELPYIVKDTGMSDDIFDIFKIVEGKQKLLGKKEKTYFQTLFKTEIESENQQKNIDSITFLEEEIANILRVKLYKVKNVGIKKIESMLRELGTDRLIDYLKENQSGIYNKLKAKSQNILVMYPKTIQRGNKVTSLAVAQLRFTDENWFSSSNFYIKIESASSSSITFYPYVRTEIEKTIVSRLSDASFEGVQTELITDFKNFEKAVTNISNVRVLTKVGIETPGAIGNLKAVIPMTLMGKENLKPGSIPQGSVRASVPRRKRSAFTSRTASVRSILRETRPYTESIGDFITGDIIAALTKREMLRRMPIGPKKGPPLSSKVLTYRTGRFVNSLEVLIDVRNKQVSYYYDPIYRIHEKTSRNPENLISASINSVTRLLFNKKFNIVKSNDSE